METKMTKVGDVPCAPESLARPIIKRRLNLFKATFFVNRTPDFIWIFQCGDSSLPSVPGSMCFVIMLPSSPQSVMGP